MKLAVGVDHFIYGWVFFGIVIGLLFWFGSFWRDPPGRSASSAPQGGAPKPMLLAGAALGTVALATAWPLYAEYLERPHGTPLALSAPPGAAGWSLEPEPAPSWQPQYVGAAASTLGVYRNGERSVVVYLGHYRNQRQGAELVGWQNMIAGGSDSPWQNTGESLTTEALRGGEAQLRQTRLRWANERLLVWDWYRIAGHDLSDPYLAKALLAREKLLGRGDDSAAIVLAAPYEARTEAAAQTLRLFIRDMLPAIEATLAAAAQGRPE